MIEQSLQLGTIPSAPGGLLAEDSLASSRLQRGGLCCRVLFVGRNARVADEHSCGKVSPMTLSLQYLFATRKAEIWASLEVIAQTFVCAMLLKRERHLIEIDCDRATLIQQIHTEIARKPATC
jgi:hypothetical protein